MNPSKLAPFALAAVLAAGGVASVAVAQQSASGAPAGTGTTSDGGAALTQQLQSEIKADNATVTQLDGQLRAAKATVTQLEGQLKVTMLDEILFPEGGWNLSQQGRATLLKIAPTLKNLKNTRIVVNGYTDNVPIAAGFRDRLPSNWELAAGRAADVVRYLQSQGVNPDLMSAASYGETYPVAANDSPANRSRNRRIELTLVGPST